MHDVLSEIVAATRASLQREPLDEAAARDAAVSTADDRLPGRFAEAIRRELAADPIRIIAEIKSASPSAGVIVESPDVEAIAMQYRDGGAAAVSIVTERQFFHGSREWVARAAISSGLPVVMKDFIVERSQIYRAVADGADAILLLASLLDANQIRDFLSILGELRCDGLVEVHDDEELERAVSGGARIIGVNNRDLRTFKVDIRTSEGLIAGIPADVVKVSESGIRTREEVLRLEAAGFDALLVGESLLRQDDRRGALGRLLGS